jgi:hypothetical protein
VKERLLLAFFLALAGTAWCDIHVQVGTGSTQAGADTAVDIDVTTADTLVGAIQLAVTYDPEALVIASVDWLPSSMGAAARHAEHVDGDAGRIALAAFAPAGATLADCTWRLNMSVAATAGGGTYDLHVLSVGTPDDAASFATDGTGKGESLAVAHGAVQVTDLRAQAIVATTLTNGTVAISWVDPGDQDRGYRIERSIVDDTPIDEWVVDNPDAEYQGAWTVSTSVQGWYGANYQHDGNTDHGNKWARFHVGTTNAIRAQIFLWWVAHANRASNVPVTIHATDGDHALTVNEKTNGSRWNAVGTYDFTTNGYVEFGNTDANGYVIVDAVKFVAVNVFPWETVVTVAEGVVSHVDGGVVAGISYRYRIHTLLSGGDGPSADSGLITVSEPGGSAYALNVSSGSGDGTYHAGSVVRIEADSHPGTMVFAAWTGDTAVVTDRLSANTTVRMPAVAVNVGATYQAADADADGMNDAWELAQFGSVASPLGSATGDIDGDGFINVKEYRARTDPLDGSSLLVIEGVAVAATGVHAIAWQSAAGCTYALQWAPSPTGAWETVRSAISPTPPTNTVSLSNGAGAGFLRIVVR